jgi:ATP-dependent helicase/DNAse subunit B
MPITLITGPANAGKAQLVMDGVRRHVAHGEEPLLVVPTRMDADYYRRELAGEGAAMGVQVERFDGLIGEAVRRGGIGAPVLGGLARERLLAAISARPDGGGGGFVRALSALLAELRVRRVTPARLSAALGRWAAVEGQAALAGEAGDLFERYDGLLRRIGRVDEEQRAIRALDTLRGKPALWGHTPVLFYGFDDLTRLQLDAIETLGAVVGASVTVSLTYEPGRTALAGRASAFQALEPLAAEHRRLDARAEYYAPGARAALSHIERSLFEADSDRADPAGAVRLLEGGGERAELELVAREIRALLATGMAPGEIAVIARSSPGTAELIEEVFSQEAIPYSLQQRRPLADSAIGRALLGVLRCVPARGQGPGVPAACAEGTVAQAHGTLARSDDEHPQVDSAGTVEDLLGWLRAPGLVDRRALVDELEAGARRAGAGGAEQARVLWEQRNWRLETIDHLHEAQERGARPLIERAMRELQWLFAAPRRRAASVLCSEELEDGQALAAGRRALEELGELARLAPELAPADAIELATALEGVELLVGERPSPDAVAVLDPLALRARRVRALFVCRLQEGAFPAPARPQPFLAEEERRRLAEVSGLRLGEYEDALAAERYLLYAVVSRPEELLVLSWHSACDDGSPATASLFVDDVCDLFDPSLRDGRRRRALGAVGWTGERDGTSPGPQARLPIVDQSAAAERIAPLRDRELLAELRAHTWSASSLEAWMSCPVRWLVERLLRADDLDSSPEPLARGGLAHVALKETLEGLRLQTGSARLTPGRLQLARTLLARALADHAGEFPLSAAPERRPGLRRRLEADLERYLRHAAERDSELEPAHLELGFGFSEDDQRGEGSALEAFDLGGGVMLRGRIDRVDVGADGQAVVYDYKGRSASPAGKWIAGRDLQVALYMRAIEQLLGVRAVGGFYQPLTGADLRARGVLDDDGGVELDCVRGDAREHQEVRELLEEAMAAAREAAGQAGRGELRARPQTCAFKGGCMYPTICRCEHR